MSENLNLGLERLEQRKMMAGDVAVNVTAGGDLVINGDNADNKVVVTSAEPNNMFFVEGLDGTTINGQTGGVLVRNVSDDIRINLRGGDNSILLSARNEYNYSNRFEVDDVRFNSRGGNDIIALQQVDVQGDFRAFTGGGDDLVMIDESELGSMRLQTGAGADAVLMNFSTVTRLAQVASASGKDTVLLVDNTFNDDARFRLGGGQDYVASSNDQFNDDLSMIGGGANDIAVNDVDRPSTVVGTEIVSGFESEEVHDGLDILVQVLGRLEQHEATNEYFDLYEDYLD